MLNRPSLVIAWTLLLGTFGGIGLVNVAGAQDNVFPSTGNVGIGTTTPQAPLEIWTSGLEALMWDNGNGRLQNSSDALVWDRCGFKLLLDADNNQTCSSFQIFRDVDDSSLGVAGILLSLEGGTSWLDLDGQLGIGTRSPDAKLHVADGEVSFLFDGTAPVQGLALDVDIATNWSRGFKIMTGGSGTLFGFGALVSNGTNLTRGYIGGNSTEDTVWADPWMTFLPDGKVGIGLIDPGSLLAVAGTIESTAGGFKFPDGTVQTSAASGSSNSLSASDGSPVNAVFVDAVGNVGVGTTFPGNKLSVVGSVESTSGGFVFPDGTIQTTAAGAGDRNSLDASDGLPVDAVFVDGVGRVGIGTTSPLTELDVRGTTTTYTLEVTGGSDLSEAFDVDAEGPIEPGMVVSIDPERPGGLRLAREEYDRTVAGVVSGAGGVRPGMVMGQAGTLAAGEHPIALSGRAYVLADASGGPIRPGDLLTTSSVPGHAMSVADHDRAVGSILGKAMTSLDEGRGLVLVLVALQ